MDPLPDFGLFELLAATGIAWLARQIYSRAWLGYLVLVVSILAPVGVIFLADSEGVRWLGALCLATALLNAGFIFPLLRASHSEDGTSDLSAAEVGQRSDLP